MKNFFLFLYLGFTINLSAQKAVVDTIPFHTKSTLLVFKAKINGHETNFAMDTGASTSVLTSSQAVSTNLKFEGSLTVNDSNENKSSAKRGIIETVTIGSQTITNASTVVFDMPFLVCNDLFLLGANIINQFNWKIDFEKKLLYVSKTPFEITNDMLEMKVKFKKNRHFTDITIQNYKLKNCLIDTGFNDFFEVSSSQSFFKKLQKKNESTTISSKRFSMGLTSMQSSTNHTFSFDGLQLNNTTFDDVKVDLRENIENKIGLKFFSTLSTVLIMNNSNLTYHLQLSNQPVSMNLSFDADIYLKNGALTVVGKTTNEESSATELEIDEQVISLNGKKASDFKDECEFILWKLENAKETECIIEKTNGQKIIVKKQFLKTT
jgi:gag-polyprotein putative aspartyl protease